MIPHLDAVRVEKPPVIDGKLDEAAWQRAKPTEAFTQKFPNEGRAPTDRTTMRVLYDDDAIYIAFDCEQTHSAVVERLTRRDRLVESDRVEVDLGTRADGKSAFRFVVNAAGVLVDSLLFNDTDSSSDWDEVWDARTSRTSRGWSAEIMIPLRILRFEAARTQSWDFQARRYISERQETDEWAFIPRDVAGEVSHYGRLDDLRDLTPTTPIELRPFVLGRIRNRDAASSQLANGVDASASVGLDLKWHPTQSLTLDAAVNPDFGQVEADQLVLNLTKFEQFYPEKRPFFLEGIDTFSTPRQIIYTRRIGRAAPPPATRIAPFGEQLVDLPSPAPIWFASKLTGKLSNDWTIGTLQAVTGENTIDVQLAGGKKETRLVDPTSSFNALRVKRAVGDNGYVGALFTAKVNAESTSKHALLPPRTRIAVPELSNPGLFSQDTSPDRLVQLCPDASYVAVRSRCFNDAYVAALDWLWRSDGGEWVTGGQLTATTLQKGQDRYVADGTVIHPGDVGTGAYGFVAKEGGKHWVGQATYEYEGRKLDYTDFGFNQRSNDVRWRVDLEYRELEKWWKLLESHAKLEYFGRMSLQGLWLGSGIQANVSGKLTNFWNFFSEVHWRPTWFDDREVGDGTALQRSGLFGYELEISSDPTKKVSFELITQTQWISNGFFFDGAGGLLFRVLPQLDVEVLPTATFTTGEPRFTDVGPNAGQYLFGRLQAESIGTTLRATYTFTPRLTLQAYGQVFLAAGHYSDFTQFQSDPAARRPVIHLQELQPFTSAIGRNPDFLEGALNVNVVLRWEYRLGSIAYLVYTRSQAPAVTLAPGEQGNLSLGAVTRAPATDVVMLKLSYFWSH